METWKSIPGFEHYEASSAGRIRSTSFEIIRKNGKQYRHQGRIISQQIRRDDYFVVALYVNKKAYIRKVHRLVYSAFNGPIPQNLVIDHINNDKRDNRIENLQAITNAENLRKDSWRKRKEKLPLGVHRNSKAKTYIAQIGINGSSYYIGSYSTAKDAEIAYQSAKVGYENNGAIPGSADSPLKRVRNFPHDGYKVCPCCGMNLPLSDYYESRGRRQGKCKSCFKQDKKRRKNSKT